MKIIKAWMSLAMSATMGLYAYAGLTKFGDVTVDYGSASTNWVGGELVLTYTTSSSLEISNGVVNADILVVGGGGGGGGGYSSNYGGSGGGGGKVEASELSVFCGELEISVGVGGNGGASGKAGAKGVESSVSGDGFKEVVAAGGAAGAAGKNGKPSAGVGASGSGMTGVMSGITGYTYGVGGAAGDANAPGSPAANTGNGGKGGMKNSTANKCTGGDGGSGVVVVRLTDAYKNTSVTLRDLTLGVGEEIVDFAEQTTGAAVDIIYSEVVSTSFNPEDVARGERTKEGRFALVGLSSGETTVTIVVRDEQEKTQTTYTTKAVVTPSIPLK